MTDSKDPISERGKQPTRQGGGNTPVTGEMHNSKKAEKISADKRFTMRKETQPGRQGGDGNVPATGEMHDSKMAEHVTADSRFNG